MKLRNKQTGEIGYLQNDTVVKRLRVLDANNDTVGDYISLAELNSEWEDYEEQKEGYWFIEDNGVIQRSCHYEDLYPTLDKARKDIGNYFDTREEAEKAVEKLKAWKRLKDKGFRFTGINDDEDSQELITQCGILCEADIYHLEKDADFLLIFGGEE